MRIGGRRAAGCATLQGGRGSTSCGCRSARVAAGGWLYPAPCGLLLRSSRLVDAATGVATVGSIPFGPHLLHCSSTLRSTAVNVLGEEPRRCVPAGPARVATCDAATAARAAAVVDACLVHRGYRPSVDRPGDGCAAPVAGTPSVVRYRLGRGCVRVSVGANRTGGVANDWAPAAGGGVRRAGRPPHPAGRLAGEPLLVRSPRRRARHPRGGGVRGGRAAGANRGRVCGGGYGGGGNPQCRGGPVCPRLGSVCHVSRASRASRDTGEVLSRRQAAQLVPREGAALGGMSRRWVLKMAVTVSQPLGCDKKTVA